jgi:DNA modification methylase
MAETNEYDKMYKKYCKTVLNPLTLEAYDSALTDAYRKDVEHHGYNGKFPQWFKELKEIFYPQGAMLIKNKNEHEPINETVNDIEGNKEVLQAIFDVHDTKAQAGLKWRQKEVNAVKVLVANGWTLDKILRELRHNGMTESTARKIIEDAVC